MASASNLANPAVTFPDARIAVGASYHLGGYTITNKEVAAMLNRFHARVEYAPSTFIGFGVDLGATQVEVDRYYSSSDSIPVFHGKYGFSGGAHLKLSSPAFLNNLVSIIGIGQATYFTSKNQHNATYRGIDGAGVIGLQFHLPGFGYISTGPLVYLINGTNVSYTGKENFYSNSNNIRGWIAVDYFPKMKDVTSNKPYISLEVSVSPKANYSERIPVQEFSISLSIGAITGRLYGIESDVDWEP